MDAALPFVSRTPPPDRPSAARPPRRPTLGARLAWSVALSVAMVVGVLTIAAVRIAARQIESDLRETARLTAIAVADDIELRPEPVTGDTLVPVLRSFMNAAIDLYSISVFRAEDGAAVPVVSTSVVEPPPPALMREVIASGEEVWNDTTPHLALVAVPVRRDDIVTGAVAVAVSLAGVERLQRTAGLVAAGGAAFTIGALTLLINLFARRLILEPLHEIRRVILRARTGDLSARADVARDDEMRDVADGLNAMLAELDDLHRSLSERVSSATGELRERNQQLVRSYESVLTWREAAGRAQQLAAVGQTVANVAHQIGTPLNLVSGHVQLLQQEIDDPALRRRLRIVQEQVERVVTTVRDLLERATPRPDRQPVGLASVITRLRETMSLRLAAAGVSLDLRLPADLPPVMADESQLELALVNLVTNAIDAMPEGGRLGLQVEPAPAGVRILVRDSGSGIAADLLPRIFDPWVTTKPAGRGTGLGLSITRDVIVGLGGTIVAASSPGHGTTFTIELPAAAPVQV